MRNEIKARAVAIEIDNEISNDISNDTNIENGILKIPNTTINNDLILNNFGYEMV